MKVALSLLLLKVAAVVAKPQKPRVLAACLEADKNQPLVEPRVIQSDEDELRFELNIAAGSVGDLLPCGIRFRSRLYEGTFPGPTIMTRRGQLVNMSLINHLGPEDPNVPVVPNFFHTPNTTNLHIHFIHASPGGSQDNVMRKLVPGQTLEYSFPLHEEHASGTGFYHPHYHGSVYYQMYNGMAGAWIMQDEADREYEQAPELEAMTEHVLVLQDLDLGRHEDIMKMDNQLSGDQRYQWWARGGGPHSNMPIDFENPNNLNFRLLLVNGQYNPKTTLRKGEIKRLRLVNALTTDSVHFMFDAPGCRLWELAKDSIYLNKPMEASSVFIAAGSRVDVAARCDGDDIEVGQLVQLLSDHDESQLHIGSPLDDGQQFLTGYIWSTIAFVPDHESKTNQAIVTFEITQEGEPMYLPSKLPSLPSYTQRLIDESAATETLPDELIKELVFAGPATIYDRPEDFHRGVLRMEFRDVNHMLYNDTILLWNQTLGMLDEWHLFNIDDPYADNINPTIFSHHFHFHTNHFLMMDDDPETGGLFFRKGEVRDTIPFYPTKYGNYSRSPIRIRVLPLDYDGVNIVHCHQADHADQGMAALFGMNKPDNYDDSSSGGSHVMVSFSVLLGAMTTSYIR